VRHNRDIEVHAIQVLGACTRAHAHTYAWSARIHTHYCNDTNTTTSNNDARHEEQLYKAHGEQPTHPRKAFCDAHSLTAAVSGHNGNCNRPYQKQWADLTTTGTTPTSHCLPLDTPQHNTTQAAVMLCHRKARRGCSNNGKGSGCTDMYAKPQQQQKQPGLAWPHHTAQLCRDTAREQDR
jgi:hypothetical protein